MLRYKEERVQDGMEVSFLRLCEALRLVKKRVGFQIDGIYIVSRVLGISIGRKWFDRSRLYEFGYAVNGHSREQTLQFGCLGEGQIVLAKNVLKEEVVAFIKHLHEEGFDYNQSRKLP